MTMLSLQKKFKSIARAFLCLTAFLAIVTISKCSSEEKNTFAQFSLYSADSPFNQEIPENPQIDPNSELMVQSLIVSKNENGFSLDLADWTIPVFYANGNTRKYDVKLTPDWTDEATITGIPIPDGAFPDPEDDGHMVIIDFSSGLEYDFWQAKKENGAWSASWSSTISLSSDGVYPNGGSCRGSGFALLAGVIWPEELVSGKIDHALVFCYDRVKGSIAVWPATEADGESTSPNAIPEGARVQLDPSLDLNTLGLTPVEMTIAKALQQYGMILCDRAAAFKLQGVSRLSYQRDPYNGLPDVVLLNAIPADKFRIIKMTVNDLN